MLIALLLAVSMLTFGAMNLLGDPLFNILGPSHQDEVLLKGGDHVGPEEPLVDGGPG